jgi:hypothetical protein
MTAFADRVLDALGPGFRDAAGDLLPEMIAALTDDAAAVDELLTVPDGDLTSAPLADLATSPYPGWLGQLAGLRVPAGLDLDEARRYIAGRGVSRRGTPTAIRTAAAGQLTGTGKVELRERDGSPWRLRVITYAAETPDPAAVLAAVQVEKPVGIALTHEVRLGQSFGQLAATGQTWGDLRTQTWDQIRRTVPNG